MSINELGRPIQAVCLSAAAYGVGSTGEPLIYAVSSGKPCKLFVIRLADGVCLHSCNLEGSSHTWGVAVTPDGAVYIGGDGLLYRWRAGMEQAENLGEPIAGETYFWRLDSDEQGRVYGGTYPGGKVFGYDPASGSYRDYGQMVETEQYTRSLSVMRIGERQAGMRTSALGGGKLYAGIGTQQAHIVEVDIDSGSKRIIELPEAYREQQMVYDLDAIDGRLYARFQPSNHLLVYDVPSGEWIDRIEDVLGLDVSPPDRDGGVYLIKEGRLHRYAAETRTLTATGAEIDQHARDFGWFQLDDPEHPGECLVSAVVDGRYWIYNPRTDRLRWRETALEGPPVAIQSLARGPEGGIYAGGYFAGGLAKYDTSKGTLSSYSGLGQSEGLTAYRGDLYMGVYPNARIYRYDPREPWQLGKNPEMAFTLHGEKQDRPFAIIPAGEELAIGTVPGYGQLGGALTLYAKRTGVVETYRDIVQSQSVISLAYRDGIIFGGTSVWGGLGAPPAESEAKLFLWDQIRREKVWEGVPVAGERAISSLAVDTQGMLWGLTAGTMFRFDPAARQIVFVKVLFPYDWSEVKHYWRGGYLRSAADGTLYGTAVNKLFTYDPSSDRLTVLSDDAALFAEDEAGRYYFARKDVLCQYIPD